MQTGAPGGKRHDRVTSRRSAHPRAAKFELTPIFGLRQHSPDCVEVLPRQIGDKTGTSGFHKYGYPAATQGRWQILEPPLSTFSNFARRLVVTRNVLARRSSRLDPASQINVASTDAPDELVEL